MESKTEIFHSWVSMIIIIILSIMLFYTMREYHSLNERIDILNNRQIEFEERLGLRL